MTAGIALLGSTGSIGRSALRVMARHPDRFKPVVLSAYDGAAELAEQAARFAPRLAVLADAAATPPSSAAAGATEWRCGADALLDAVAREDIDVVLNAVVGAAGLEASLAALRAGKRLALANKESLVAGGELVLNALREGGGSLIPVDSEHAAIWQCLGGRDTAAVRRVMLTASGGPFRDRPREALAAVTPRDALRHPTWSMGAKITVDSATLANKALEVIEAHFLFGLPYDRIDVVIHPQSVVHSMVEFRDGSVLAQLGPPSMELPILQALSYPERMEDGGVAFDPVAAGPLAFEALDAERFPAFRLGLAAGRAGGTAPAAFNAANEEAVAAFLDGRLEFLGIADVIARVMERHVPSGAADLESVLAADREARAEARTIMGGR